VRNLQRRLFDAYAAEMRSRSREINDGLLASRFAPSQRAWVLSGVRVPVSPVVDASTGRDADDR